MAPDGTKPLTRLGTEAVSAAYAAWAATAGNFSAAAINRARNAFIDIVACLIPGAGDDAAVLFRFASRDWGLGPCTVVGSPVTRPAPLAALANGISAHALDFDDNLDPAKAHATAVIVPALLALGELRAKSGRDVLAAYIVGIEIATRVGQGLNPFHRNRGWHATSTVGAIAATAAAGQLIALDADRMRHALNMATSFAGGFMSQFGSMTKPLHAGKAAEAGVVCALLAEAGMTAGSEAFAGPNGMAQLMVGPDLEDLRRNGFAGEHGQTLRFETSTLGNPLAILAHGLKVKRYPTCASTHRALDGLLELRARHDLSASEVARIDVFAPVTHFNNLMYTDPTTAAEAKFSMEFCLGLALVTGGVALSDFAPAAIGRPDVRAAMGKVVRHPLDKSETEAPTRVEVILNSGRLWPISIDAPRGRADNPLTEDDLWQKLRLCCRVVVADEQVQRIERALHALDSDAPVTNLTAELRFGTAP